MNGEQHDNRQVNYAEVPPIPAPGKPRSLALPYKSPAWSTVLSLMPGLGQIYVGYYPQGFMNIVIVAGCITMLASGLVRGLTPFFGVFLAFFWIFQMIDAYRRALHYNRALDGLTGEELPEEFEMPGIKGSLPAGVVLVALGVLIILDLNFNVSMEWVEDWWPLSLVGFGGWLIYKSRAQKG